MKIMVVSNTPWNTDNSFGNTYSNIFEGIEGIEFANIYCSTGYPKNSIKCKYFQIYEKLLIKNLINSKYDTGREIYKNNKNITFENKQSKMINFIRKRRWRIFFWARRFIWWIGRWKSNELKKFIDDFKPDFIFIPLYHSTYLNKIDFFVQKYTNVRMVGYVSNDIYTLKIFSLSIFFWIDRLVTRHMIKKTVDKCDYLYVISEIQKIEYEKCFNKKCKILTKGAVFSKECPIKKTYNKPLKLVYTGNIGAGRWKTLGMITNVLKLINRSEIKAQLFIYTTTPMSKKMEDTLDLKDIVFLMGGVSFEKIPQIQDDSDILIHVESIGLKDRLGARHSFSTKLVDYFYRARCILAVGPPDVASIDYLIKNDAAIIANNPGEILQKLNELIDYPDKITEYAIKSWECGKRNHDIYNIQNNLHRDLQKLCNDNNKI